MPLGVPHVTDILFARQPGSQHLQRGGGEPRRLGRAVVIDVAGQLKEELGGQVAEASAGPESHGGQLPSALRGSGNRDGGNMKVIICTDGSPSAPHAHLVRAPGVVDGKFARRELWPAGRPGDHAGVAAAHQGQLEQSGSACEISCGVRQTVMGMMSMTTTCIAPRPLARNTPR